MLEERQQQLRATFRVEEPYYPVEKLYFEEESQPDINFETEI